MCSRVTIVINPSSAKIESASCSRKYKVIFAEELSKSSIARIVLALHFSTMSLAAFVIAPSISCFAKRGKNCDIKKRIVIKKIFFILMTPCMALREPQGPHFFEQFFKLQKSQVFCRLKIIRSNFFTYPRV